MRMPYDPEEYLQCQMEKLTKQKKEMKRMTTFMSQNYPPPIFKKWPKVENLAPDHQRLTAKYQIIQEMGSSEF